MEVGEAGGRDGVATRKGKALLCGEKVLIKEPSLRANQVLIGQSGLTGKCVPVT